MIDSHCHLADRAFAEDLGDVVDRARAAGLRAALCVLAAEDDDEARQARRLSALWPEARFSIGVHPHQAHAFSDRLADLDGLVREMAAATPRLSALGEIGLDYHYDFSPRDVQRRAFAIQIGVARDLGLPIVVHTREADADTVSLLRAEGAGIAGVFHCFSGSQALAEAALDLGFHISVSGIVTFPRASTLRAIAAVIPADRLLVETDCPYLAPVPFRGRRNEPAYVSRVVATLAEVRQTTVGVIADAVTENFASLFGQRPAERAGGGPSSR